jgi:hypothetical protein
MGHKQPKTQIKTDNSTAFGVFTNNIQPRCTKTMDMHFHWLWCRESQDQFNSSSIGALRASANRVPATLGKGLTQVNSTAKAA